jgi:hypothetical protein
LQLSLRTILRTWLRAVRGGAARALALWHLCSLDAPTVAVVWSAAFAWAAGMRVPAWTLAIQALAVWAVYVGDRLLDARAALRTGEPERLRERHFFHWRYRRVLGPAAAVALCAAAGLILVTMPAMARVRNAAMAGAALAYFARVHFGGWDEDGAREGAERLFTKEMLVGVLFAVGCSLPAMGRMPSSARGAIFCVVGFFALLAWLNCRSIEQWEGAGLDRDGGFPEFGGSERARNETAPSGAEAPRLSGLEAARLKSCPDTSYPLHGVSPQPVKARRDASCREFTSRFQMGLLLAGVGILAAVLLAAVSPRAAALVTAGALSAGLLAWLDGRRGRMKPVMLRAAADLVLLTPVVLLLLARVGR